MNELILGLLYIHNMTAYEIRKSIQNGMDLISNDSMGNIHSSIKLLLKREFIIFKELVDKGKFKKIYSITSNGKEHFKSWVNSPFESNQKRNQELKKIFFMSFSEKKTRLSRIQEYIEKIDVEKDKLEQINRHSLNLLKELPEEQQEIAFFQVKTIQYGLAMMEFEIKWYEEFLKELVSGGNFNENRT